jgi:hypothetical protein
MGRGRLISEALPRVIGLCGRAGVGKDEVAKILGGYGYERTAFANELKREVDERLKWEYLSFSAAASYGDSGAEIERLLFACRGVSPWEKPTPPDMRRLLQLWGSEYRRQQDPGYWTKRVIEQIESSPEQRFSVSDVRFPNEAEAIEALGGVVWKIERPGIIRDTALHVSESMVDLIPAPVIIQNSESLDFLRYSVRTALHLSCGAEAVTR